MNQSEQLTPEEIILIKTGVILRSKHSGNCPKCGIYRWRLDRDHIIPRHRGGTDDPANIQYICANCHDDKSYLEDQWKHTPETLAKLRAARNISPETRAKIGVANQRRKISPETRAKLSAASRATGRLRFPDVFGIDTLPRPKEE